MVHLAHILKVLEVRLQNLLVFCMDHIGVLDYIVIGAPEGGIWEVVADLASGHTPLYR